MASSQDASLETLLRPFVQGQLAWPQERALFLRARYGAALAQITHPEGLLCEQSFAPLADALTRRDWTLADEAQISASGDRYPLVLVLPPRQRQEARALLARAVDLATPGGVVIACQHNDEGARTGESDLQQLAGLAGKLTKNHCRVYWTAPLSGSRDAELHRQWLTLDAPRRIVDGRFVSRPGLFAWDRIDPASALLAEQLPPTLAGSGADLGSGWGYLSSEVLARCPGVTRLDLFEAEARALALARDNVAPLAGTREIGFHWRDVVMGIPSGFDFIVTNPPFHGLGREDRPDTGQRFIGVAATALRSGGDLYLVANRHLPYEQMLGGLFDRVELLAERGGFKTIRARKG